ncbi:MAG TPA: hypothetical protein VGQ82_02820, partial [Chthoniobacterales bacterium]|nr:hypothetical protein [Chthoniobacterales bacterium]
MRFFPAGFGGQRRARAEDRSAEELIDAEVSQQQTTLPRDPEPEQPIGGGIISGISRVFRSPYL